MKTACVYHRVDLDGWMSAAIVKAWWTKDNSYIDDTPNISRILYRTKKDDELYFIGYHYGDPIPDLSKYDRIIMVDVSLPNNIMFDIACKLGVNFIWIDHHQAKINEVSEYLVTNHAPTIDGLTTIEGRPVKAACELTWEHFFPDDKMPEIVRRLGRYDCFAHKGTSEEREILEFQYGARATMKNVQDCFMMLIGNQDAIQDIMDTIYLEGVGIYKYLREEARQVYDKRFELYFRNDIVKGNITENGILTFICFNRERFNPINFGIDYHKEGYDGAACFWYDKGKWQFSLYNDNGKVDVSKIAKQFGGGGHAGASGFVLNTNEFINLILNK